MAVIKNFDTTTKTLTMEFTNTTSLVNYLKEAKINGAFATCHSLSSQKTNDPWCGTKDFAEALNFLEFGWTVKSEKLADKLKLAKKNAPMMSRRKVTPSVVGYTPIVPNYLTGIPLNMLDSKMTTIKQRVVTINKDISYNARYSESSIEDNSIKAFQIIQALESSGVRCNMNVILGIDFRGKAKNVHEFIVKVRIKNSSEKLNISKTSFGLVNPGMLRRIMFRLIETVPDFTDQDTSIRYGYGTPITSSVLKTNCEKSKQYYLSRDIEDAQKEANNFTKQ